MLRKIGFWLTLSGSAVMFGAFAFFITLDMVARSR